MAVLRFTTDDLPAAERFPCWYDLALKAHVRSHVRSDEEADFRASLRTVCFGEVRVSQMVLPPLRASRTAG